MNNYTNHSKIEKIQKYELEILSEFHKICELNNLKYILDFGTLLGAIRHEGFIPWDDDIDVAMTRKDFLIFKEIATTRLPENMFLQTHESDSNYYFTFPKIRLVMDKYKEKALAHFDIVHGPWIDIFIYDFKHDKKEVEYNKQKEYNKAQKYFDLITPSILTSQNYIKTLIKKMVIFLLKKSQSKKNKGIIKRYSEYKYKKLKSILMKYPDDNLNGEMMTYSFIISSNIPEESLTLNKRDFENRKLQKFENYYFYIPDNYDEILKDRYGDYNELPPLQDRKSGHQWAE